MFVGGGMPAWVLVMFMIGVVLIALEVFVIPGFGRFARSYERAYRHCVENSLPYLYLTGRAHFCGSKSGRLHYRCYGQ